MAIQHLEKSGQIQEFRTSSHFWCEIHMLDVLDKHNKLPSGYD